MFKKVLINLVTLTVPSIFIFLILLELIFRLVVPAAQAPYYYYDQADRILRFDTHRDRDGVYTMGKLAQARARWHVNNMGWNSNIDYQESGRSKPLIAVIGDSYVEALQVDADQSYPAVLRTMCRGLFDVYSFGISGASLSQYLQMSRYVGRHFNPDIIVFNVVHNDFLEAICSYSPSPWMLCIAKEGEGCKESGLIPYQPKTVMRLIRRSSIARYVVMNLGFSIQKLKLLFSRKREYSANVDIGLYERNKEEIESVTDCVLDKIELENRNRKIIFIIDAPRQDLYKGTLPQSKALWLNHLLQDKCAQHGFSFIDLTNIFSSHHRLSHEKFESEYDYHWNAVGHRTVAAALYGKLEEMALVK